MSEEAEKRFHSIMDKLFHASKPKPKLPSLPEVQLSKGKKRPNPVSASAAEAKLRKDIQNSTTTVQAPLCRPWDREDFMRRLATFKSMTWFAKPKVISAINCARRGWVNVDMDIIACEACGARLLFSTPSSWTQQQVEKAALVFSLKLDNGHKLLCPWVDNACDEMLAHFPPATAQDLVDGYKERSSALLELLALPLISSKAIDYMRSPELEHFLQQSSVSELGGGSSDTSQREYLGSGCDAVSANLYFQAQKLISLCGWKPRSLPYVVDCKDRLCQSAKDVNHLDLSHVVANIRTPTVTIYSSASDKSMQANEDPIASGALQSDLHSVVLECSLCGATVGLWAFSTVSRPVEFFRLVGNSEVASENNSSHRETALCPANVASGIHASRDKDHVNNVDAVVNTASNGAPSSHENLLNLNLTIAGGPPPTKQNFRATISIPVVGQNLRARFSSDYDFRDRICVNPEESQSGSHRKCLLLEGKKHTENMATGQDVQPEAIGPLESKRHDDGQCNFINNDQSPCLNHSINKEGDAFRNSDNHITSERPDVIQQGTETGMHDSILKSQTDGTQVQSSGQDNKLDETADNAGIVSPAVGDSCITNPGANISTRNGEIGEEESLVVDGLDDCNLQQMLETDIECSELISIDGYQESSRVEACLEANPSVDIVCNVNLRGGDKNSDVQDILISQPNSQGEQCVEDREQIPVNNEVAACGTSKDLKQQPLDKAMEFDPIRQHRHFCPWIAAAGGAPGWQQTLSALQRQKGFSQPSASNSPSSPSVIKVDDPVASVRKLFTSSPAKRMKPTHGST